MSPIITDADHDPNEFSGEDAADAFLKRMIREDEEEENPVVAENASEDVPEEAPSDEENEDETANDDQEDEGSEAPKAKAADDDFVVKLTVDGKELDVPVKDLKRLYGQEQALRSNSEAVAAKRKTLEEEGGKYVVATERLLKNAYERYQPYSNVDWALLATQVGADAYKAYRDEATKAYTDVQFLSQELDGFMSGVQQQRQSELVEQAQATIAELSDPDKGIPGFSPTVYSEMHGYAVSQGLPKDMVDSLVSAPALRLLHKAMLYDKGQKASATTKVVSKSAKKVVKSTQSSGVTRDALTSRPNRQAMNKLKATGTVEDAAKAFLSRWSDD